MQKYEIKIAQSVFNELVKTLINESGLEAYCYLFGKKVVCDNHVLVLIQNIHHVKKVKSASRMRVEISAETADQVYVAFGESDSDVIINCHSHPFSKDGVNFSSTDDKSDIYEAEHIRNQVVKIKDYLGKNIDLTCFSMVFGQTKLAARYYSVQDERFFNVSNVRIVGKKSLIVGGNNGVYRPTKNILGEDTKKKQVGSSEYFDRQVRMLGEEGQKAVQKLRVAVVGVGGVGSIVAEGLVRLGVEDLVLVDPDRLDKSNLNRWQTGFRSDVGKYKVSVLRRNLRKIFENINITSCRYTLSSKQAVKIISGCDVIIGCTDNEETRYILNRLALQFLSYYIDGGVNIDSDGATIRAMNYRSAVVIPALTACLDCCGIEYYDKMQVMKNLTDVNTYSQLEKAGYISGATQIIAPAVYPLNLTISSLVLHEFMAIATGFKTVAWNIYGNLLEKGNKGWHVLDIENDLESPSKNCLFCNDYVAKGESELSWLWKYHKGEIYRSKHK